MCDRNEDRYLIKTFKDETILFAVADGMGGQETNTLSSLAVKTDKFLLELGEEDEQLEGLATTLLCVFIIENAAFWVHVGDSRLTIYRSGELMQMTKDQNPASRSASPGFACSRTLVLVEPKPTANF